MVAVCVAVSVPVELLVGASVANVTNAITTLTWRPCRWRWGSRSCATGSTTSRVERSGREVSSALRAHTADFLRTSAAQRREFREEMQDLREGSRAQRNALLKLIDRFDSPQPGGAAGAA